METMHKTPGPIHGFSAAVLAAMGQYVFIGSDASWFHGPMDRGYECPFLANAGLSSGSSPSWVFIKNE